MKEPAAVKRVAVLGAGTIGGSWVALFLARGMQVTVWDPRPEAADYVRRYIADAWPALARLGMTADMRGWIRSCPRTRCWRRRLLA